MNKIQLSIPTPCHENWDKMSPEEKGKFCGSCQKTVMDFTRMSDRQLAEFFKKPVDNVCGRFYDDQLNRGIDLSVTRKRIPWIRYFFQFTLPAFLLSFKATAQGNVKVSTDSSYKMRLGMIGIIDEKPRTEKIFNGQVVDEYGEPLSHVTVSIREQSLAPVMTDANGRFSLNIENLKKPVLIISAVGFEQKEWKVSGTSGKIVLNAMWMGEVVITRRKPVRKNKRPANKETPVETELPVVRM